jgi:3-hydroxybutyryl-CoA dehydrogenase
MSEPLRLNGPACVIGAGTMGPGIALVLGRIAEVRLVARRMESLDASRRRITRSLQTLTANNVLDANGAEAVGNRIICTTSLRDGVTGCGLVIESVVEDLGAKRELLAEVETMVGPDTLLATNTSSLAIDQLAVQLQAPERFAGLHWLNPAEFVDLVELVPGSATSTVVLDSLRGWAEAAGKTVVEVGHDVAGFIVNRLQYALLREAFALVESGVCRYLDIDAVMTAGLGTRWATIGPFESLDLAGLDVYEAVARRLYPTLSNASEPAAAAQKLVAGGALGCKSGHGLYGKWAASEAVDRVGRRDRLLLEISAVRSGVAR